MSLKSMLDARVRLPDDHAFRYPSHEPGPHELGIPADTSHPVQLQTASEIERERLEREASNQSDFAAFKAQARNNVIDEVAMMLGREYPGNDNTNAFCAAIRSMKSKS